MKNLIVVAAYVIGGIASLVLLSFVLSWPVMWLWNNALVGAVTGINQVTWLQAWGISTLSGLLFKTSVSKK
jgi:hypothetical protein